MHEASSILPSSLFVLHLKRALAGSCLLALFSCHDMARVDTKGIKQEMEARTVYHINDNQLAQGAKAVGDRITHALDSVLAAQAHSKKPCPTGWNEVLEQYALPYKIKVTVVPFDSLAAFRANAKEHLVLAALDYSHRQGQPAAANIQRLEDKSFQYIAPFILPDSAAQNCFAGRFAAAPLASELGIYHLRIPTRPAALEASKGLKGMK